jgi:hypothetical protein
MNLRLLSAALLACQSLTYSLPVFAQGDLGLLTPGEKQVYHACLYAHYIDNYCRFHAWGFNKLSFRDCVIANGACECVFANGGYWGPYIDAACRAYPQPRFR